MATAPRKIPFVGSPETNPETKPFFDGTAAGKFLIRRCTACKKAHWYPRSLCPFCFGECAWAPCAPLDFVGPVRTWRKSKRHAGQL